MIRIVTIEREYGSGAGVISTELARQLGWKLWDQELSEEIARRLRCQVDKVKEREERVDPTYYRLMKAFMRGSFETSFKGSDADLLDAETLSRLFEQIILELADKGNCVIVGRAASWYLRQRADALRLFLYAPREEKVQRIMRQSKPREDAEDLVETVDQERAAFVKRYHGKNWPLRELYHLMLNTTVGTPSVIKLVLTEMELLQQRPAMSA